MDFLTWLKNQTNRSDEIGFVSRLISTADSDLQQYAAGYGPLEKYASSSEGKISRSIRKALREWVKVAAGARIGIFWIVDGDVIEFAEDAATRPVVAGFKDVKFDHVSEWSKMQSLFPQFRSKDYYQVPRGRVVGVGADRYRLFMPPEMLNESSLINRIMKIFGLPKDKTEVMGDEHYVTQTETGFEDFEEFDDDPFDDDNF